MDDYVINQHFADCKHQYAPVDACGCLYKRAQHFCTVLEKISKHDLKENDPFAASAMRQWAKEAIDGK